MVTLALGKPPSIQLAVEVSDQDCNSYQNAIGSARKVVRLVKKLDLETSTKAML